VYIPSERKFLKLVIQKQKSDLLFDFGMKIGKPVLEIGKPVFGKAKTNL
jgi:hypothetical protein